MATHPYPGEPVPINIAARCLRVPAGWLRAEADAGRIPALHAGRVVLVHVPTVAALLAKRAQYGDAPGLAVRPDPLALAGGGTPYA